MTHNLSCLQGSILGSGLRIRLFTGSTGFHRTISPSTQNRSLHLRAQRVRSLRVATFNMLCPWHFRCPLFGTEAVRPLKYQARLLCGLHEILVRERPDVVCLQEHPLEGLDTDLDQEVRRMYAENGYRFLFLGRTGPFARDGIALLFRNHAGLRVVTTCLIRLGESLNAMTDRVSLFALFEAKCHSLDDTTVELNSSADGNPQRGWVRFGVVTTHLSYPYDAASDARRLDELKVTMEVVRSCLRSECPNVDVYSLPLVVAGDLNGAYDAVSKYLEGSECKMYDAVAAVLWQRPGSSEKTSGSVLSPTRTPTPTLTHTTPLVSTTHISGATPLRDLETRDAFMPSHAPFHGNVASPREVSLCPFLSCPVTRRESAASPQEPSEIVTHVDHRNHPSFADHIFISNNIEAREVYLLPRDVAANVRFPRPLVGGSLEFFHNVSDHRPILCDIVLKCS